MREPSGSKPNPIDPETAAWVLTRVMELDEAKPRDKRVILTPESLARICDECGFDDMARDIRFWAAVTTLPAE